MCIIARLASNSAPTLKIPTSVKRFKRGTIPATVNEASGKNKVTLSPTLAPNCLARRSPIRILNSPATKSSIRPCTMWSGKMETLASAVGSIPFNSTGCTCPRLLNIPCPWTKGATPTTPSTWRAKEAGSCQFIIGWLVWTMAWGTMPKMRWRSSRSKPFITDNTKISTVTPSTKPSIEISDIKEIKWFCRCALVYLRPTVKAIDWNISFLSVKPATR